jgi:hypothetical protein
MTREPCPACRGERLGYLGTAPGTGEPHPSPCPRCRGTGQVDAGMEAERRRLWRELERLQRKAGER